MKPEAASRRFPVRDRLYLVAAGVARKVRGNAQPRPPGFTPDASAGHFDRPVYIRESKTHFEQKGT